MSSDTRPARPRHQVRTTRMPTDATEQMACLGNPRPYDIIIDGNRGWETRLAIRTAAALCATCPLITTCHREHAADGWPQPIRNEIRKLAAAKKNAA